MISIMPNQFLFSILPQLFGYENTAPGPTISAFRRSRFMRSILSFELDEDCILPRLDSDGDLFFPQSPHLTHIRITLREFDDCIRLLNQLGSQLQSFAVSFVFPCLRQNSNTISRMTLVNICFQFTISIN